MSTTTERLKPSAPTLASILALAGVLIAGAQVWSTWYSSKEALRLQQLTHNQQLGLQRITADREWNLRFAEFLITHDEQVFSADSATRERMKAIVLSTYPESLWQPLFGRLARATPPGRRRTWTAVQVTSTTGNRAPRIGSAQDHGNVAVHLLRNIESTVQLADYEVVVAPFDIGRGGPERPYKSLGALDQPILLTRPGPGDFAFWIRCKGTDEEPTAFERLTIWDMLNPHTVVLQAPHQSSTCPAKK